MTTTEKDIYCQHCGGWISTLTVQVNKLAHIQRIEIIPVCDICEKAGHVLYTATELTEESKETIHHQQQQQQQWAKNIEGTVQTCRKCGGTITAEYGYCRACRALGEEPPHAQT